MNIALDEVRKQAPEGATHYDKMDYWKKEGDSWHIWLESCEQWRRIFEYQKFHDVFPIKPLN